MNKLKNNKGFTLVELLVAVAILGIVIAPLANMFIASANINTMAKKEYDAMTVAQAYLEQVKAMSEYKPGDGVISEDIEYMLNVGFTHDYDVEVLAEAKTDYENMQNHDVVTPRNVNYVLEIRFANNVPTGYEFDRNNNILLMSWEDAEFRFNEAYFTINGKTEPIPYGYGGEVIKINVDSAPELDASLQPTVDKINISAWNNTANETVKIECVKETTTKKQCGINIMLGEISTTEFVPSVEVEKKSNYMVYDITVMVKNKTTKEVEAILHGQKVFD